MQFTYLGHASFLLEAAGTRILFDPFISPNELAKGVNVSTLSPDVILVSHGHADHVADLMEIAKASGALVISTFEVASWVEAQGHANVHPMNHGGKRAFDFGSVKLVNAVHSSVLPDGTYGGNPCGFILEIDGKAIYFAGDTALTMDMQLIPRWANIDCAILPIGDNFTMGIDDAILAAEFVQTKQVIGMHYDTFGYIKIDHSEAKSKFAQAGCNLILADINVPFSI